MKPNGIIHLKRLEKCSKYYKQLVSDLLEKYKELGCNISPKIQFLDSHLNFSPKNLGDVIYKNFKLANKENVIQKLRLLLDIEK